MDGSGPSRIKTTCPRDCYDACGLIAVKENGVIRRVMGDPDHAIARGTLCGKCAIVYNGVWRDEKARVTQPLRRVGPKGTASFQQISWEEAIAAVAEKIAPHMADGPASKVVHAHYTGTVGLIAGWYPLRFFQRIGATEIDPDTVCNKAGHAALELTWGDSLDGFDPETGKDAKIVIVWGANPGHAAPHMHKDWLREMRKAGTKVISIDPIAHRTARERSDTHLQVKPGTDAALAFGMMHVAQREGLLDDAFIAAHVAGFEELLPAIDAATPEATEALTGVPSAQIEEVAKAYAEGPALLWMGQGMQRTARGGNAFRALSALVALTGNVGKPGAGFCYMNGPGTRGIEMDEITCPELDIGSASVTHMKLANTIADPEQTSVFMTWNCNPVASSPDQGTLREALMREDLFTVVCDLFPTDTAAYADIVLPAASFMEFNDIVAPYFHHTLSAQVAVQAPPGVALSNQEIFRRLAAALDLDDPLLHEDDDALLARIIAMTGLDITFADLAEAGTVPLFSEPRMQFPGFVFPTPSGKIELASAVAVDEGLPLVPEPHADISQGEGQLRILSPSSFWQMNASYANDPEIQRRLGPIAVILHPDEAASRGLQDGAKVTLSNAAGSLTLMVSVSDIAQPGIGIVYKGRWPGEEPGGANINVLHAAQLSDIAEATSVHSTVATLTPIAEAAE